MSFTRDEVFSLVAERVTLAPNTLRGITVVPGLNSIVVKYGAGGTLEIGGSSLTVGNGYVIGSGEAVNIQVSNTFYLICSGVTTTAFLLRGRSEGFDP